MREFLPQLGKVIRWKLSRATFPRLRTRVRLWWEYQLALADKADLNRKLDEELGAPQTEEQFFDRFDHTSGHVARILALETRNIERLCLRYGVSITSDNERGLYETFYDTGLRVMSEVHKQRLLNKIKIERRERLESFKTWVLAISTLCSSAVALITLLWK